ncbi:MAG: nucleotide kinase domain-containing protein, partial [Chloroflexota bacterium]
MIALLLQRCLVLVLAYSMTTMLREDVQAQLDPERRVLFWRFLCERQRVWQRRFVQRCAPPWTDDPVLRRERFTNVYRELDPGTQYALTDILETVHAREDKIFNIMLYRLIGRATTHAKIGFQHLDSFRPHVLEACLKYIRDEEREPPFTAAYMVSGYTSMGSRDKAENIARLFARIQAGFAAFFTHVEACPTSAEVYAYLRSMPGFGNFLSYQVLVDLLYPLQVYGNRPLLPYSHDDWASAGPGALRGITMLLSNGSMAEHLEVMRWLRDHQSDEFTRLGLDFPYLQD